MFKSIVITLACFTSLTFTHAQTTFQKSFLEPGPGNMYFTQVVHQTSDGGYIYGGAKSTGVETSTTFIIRTDSLGDTLWTKIFLNSIGAYSITETPNGDFVVLGGILLNSLYWTYDILVFKINSNGNLLWSKTYGTNFPMSQESCSGECLKPTADGGYIILGTTEVYGAGMEDMYLVKIDSVGTMQWNKTYGGVANDNGRYVLQAADHGYALLGQGFNFGTGYSDMLLIKTDSMGVIQWSKSYGGIQNDYSKGMDFTLDHGFYILGLTSSFGTGYLDILAMKTDSLGVIQWATTLGDSLEDRPYSISTTSDGGCILSSYFSMFPSWDRVVVLSKINSAGISQWNKIATSLSGSLHLEETTDGGYIMGMELLLPAPANTIAPTLAKTDSLGNNDCVFTPFIIPVVTNPAVTVMPATVPTGTGGFSAPDTFLLELSTTFRDSVVCVPASIEDQRIEKLSVSVYPNPFDDVCRIEYENSRKEKHDLVLMNSSGQYVLRMEKNSSGKFMIEKGNLSAGIYFFGIYSQSGLIGSGTLLVE